MASIRILENKHEAMKNPSVLDKKNIYCRTVFGQNWADVASPPLFGGPRFARSEPETDYNQTPV